MHCIYFHTFMKPLILYIPLLLITTAVDAITQRILRVGLFCANNDTRLTSSIGYSNVAAGLMVGWHKVDAEQLMPDIGDIDIEWRFDECIDSNSAKYFIEFLTGGYDVIFGPPCSQPAIMVGTMSKIYDYPMFMWGPPFSSELSNNDVYPTITAVSFSAQPQSYALLYLMNRFNWTDIALIYTIERSPLIPKCGLVATELEKALDTSISTNIVYKKQVTNLTYAGMVDALLEAKDVSRVIVICLESTASRRNFLLGAVDSGMTSAEYVYLYPEIRRSGFLFTVQNKMLWQDQAVPPDGRDSDALQTAQRILLIDHEPLNDTAAYIASLMLAFTQDPFNCTNCTTYDPDSSRAPDLTDAFYLYARARNRTLKDHPEMSRNMSGSTISQYSEMQFQGETGTVRISGNGSRDPIFIVYFLDQNNKQMGSFRLENLVYGLTNMNATMLVPESVLWASWGGKRPLNEPICGFQDEDCPPTFLQNYLAIVICCVAVVVGLVVFIIVTATMLIRARRREEAALDRQWQIEFTTLVKPSQKSATASAHSLQSSLTSGTRYTLDSKKETTNHAYFLLNNEAVAARKHPMRHYLSREQILEIRLLRAIDHENVNKFIGICDDGPQFMTIWRYCSRGSLADVIETGSLQMDWFFKFSIIRDLAEGLNYLHHSLLGAHGWLSSSTCVVDERWMIKITYHGCRFIKESEKKSMKDLLWTAPEFIRDPTTANATKPGDIYSFAIICSEIATRKRAWGINEQDVDIDELLYKIKRGGRNAMRPQMTTDDSDISPSMLLLIKDCWAEDPAQRPNSEQVRSLVKSTNVGKSANLMDHVFNVLEQHASTLEEETIFYSHFEVDARMKELVEEKKKSDILLYRMLPKQVADKLKLGQSVEPESFECVTIFFSDVVSFTTLASRCTPLQVVNLLNDLYSTFDAIIDERDVYKVETIGDGYLCVSGLPRRNGNEHAREIAEMSFSLIEAIRKFRIPHMPTERIQIRVGIHTGGCVAGVVGITMPRYCLFGDSVNTAARMESNGKPMRIHISASTNNFLTKVIGGYRTESRGEVLVKGTGTMETYWLLNDEDP